MLANCGIVGRIHRSIVSTLRLGAIHECTAVHVRVQLLVRQKLRKIERVLEVVSQLILDYRILLRMVAQCEILKQAILLRGLRRTWIPVVLLSHPLILFLSSLNVPVGVIEIHIDRWIVVINHADVGGGAYRWDRSERLGI